ncbi:MAG: hypothetical protein R2737_14895 [Candidatus Nanopelagicales bacterium]
MDIRLACSGAAAYTVGDAIELNPGLRTALAELGALSDTVDVALAVGGARHNVLGLARHPEPFQFRNPWKNVVPTPGVPFLPFEVVRRVLEDSLSYPLTVLRALARYLQRPLVQLQSPPPVPSEEFLLATPGVYGAAIREFGIVDAGTRYAWWRLQSDAYERVAAEEGVDFLEVPQECVTEDGFLVREAWRDPTHGNAWYGMRVLRQLDEYFESRRRQ